MRCAAVDQPQAFKDNRVANAGRLLSMARPSDERRIAGIPSALRLSHAMSIDRKSSTLDFFQKARAQKQITSPSVTSPLPTTDDLVTLHCLGRNVEGFASTTPRGMI